MKIQLVYDVPEGDNCSHRFEDRNMSPECRYLYGEKWCTLFGSGPTVVIEGHTIIRKKLYACRRSEIPVIPHCQAPDPDLLPPPEATQ